MEREKVKKIKKVLEEGQFNTITHHQKEGNPIKISFADILIYINELESENERLLEQRNKTYNIWVKDTEQLKDRIAELEEQRDRQAYIAEELIQEKHRWTEQARKETAKEIFEKIKTELEKYRLDNEYFIDKEPNGNLWQMNASIFYLEVIDKGGLIDQIAKQYGVEE